ncbi:UNVERIFIED_CONTAM: hypothetical protein HDU68_005712, partial [Siphonaria sp. JEL0065]
LSLELSSNTHTNTPMSKIAPTNDSSLDPKNYFQSVYITKYGKQNLTYGPLPKRQHFSLPQNHVLLKIHTVALQPADVKIRNGSLKVIKGNPTPKTPCVLGYDCAGIIEQVSVDSEAKWKVGDRVMCVAVEGALTCHALVHEKHLARVPDGVSLIHAAALVTAGLTGYQALKYAQDYLKDHDGSLKKVLITNGAGGVGHVAIQLAKKVFGVDVVVTTASSAKQDFVRECGADVVVDYRKEDFVCVVSGNVNLLKCDFALDCTGETKKCKKVVKRGGFGCVVGMLGIPDGRMLKQVVEAYDMPPPPGCVFGLLNCVSGCFSCIGGGVHVHNMITLPIGNELEELGKLVESGIVRLEIDRVYPLSRAIEAFNYVEEGHVTGKVVVQVVESDLTNLVQRNPLL